MRSLTILTCAFLFISDLFGQPIWKEEKVWLAAKIIATDGTILQADRDNEIKTLKITKTEGNTSSGIVEYKNKPTPLPVSCSITIEGSRITIIASDNQKWTGEIFSIRNSSMVFSLGSLTYFFNPVTIRGPRRNPVKPEPTFKLEQFHGSWVETNRNDSNNLKIPIGPKDSLYIRIISNNEAMIKPGTGSGELEGDIKIAGDNDFTICGNTYIAKLVSESQMILYDDVDFRNHILTKTTDSFSWERKTPLPPKPFNVVIPDAIGTIDLSQNAILKNWAVYHIKWKAKTEEVITTLNINKNNGVNSYSGIISIRNTATKKERTQEGKILINQRSIQITTEGLIIKATVFQSNGDTLKFMEENGTEYHLKKLTVTNPNPPDTSKIVIDLRPEKLQKKWLVNNADRGTLPANPASAIIKELHILNQTDSLKYTGNVIYTQRGNTFNKTCTIDFKASLRTGAWITISTNGLNWNSQLFKSDGKEIIFGRKNKEIRYTLK